MSTYDLTLAALADPTRRAILKSLLGGPASVGELARGLPVSRPAVSQHLKILREAGLASVERRGTQRLHALRLDGLARLRGYLEALWNDAVAAIDAAPPR